ncbi:uncharacterized protein LOC127919191 isoform X2 [Oncorhynchus keta]|nr:uncharacterized protein LOC127919191 isoform X2 [Oncorhynchus keta]
MHCNCSQAPNGTTTYHLSEPPPSMNCETEWAYPNGSTLTFKGETNANQVLGLTRQSITTTVCLGSLKYTVDCVKPQVVNKVECNCTMEPRSPSNPDHIKDVRPDAGFSCSTVSCVYQEWFINERTSSQLDTTMGSIGVNMGQHPCGTLLPVPQRIDAVLRAILRFVHSMYMSTTMSQGRKMVTSI